MKAKKYTWIDEVSSRGIKVSSKVKYAWDYPIYIATYAGQTIPIPRHIFSDLLKAGMTFDDVDSGVDLAGLTKGK